MIGNDADAEPELAPFNPLPNPLPNPELLSPAPPNPAVDAPNPELNPPANPSPNPLLNPLPNPLLNAIGPDA